MIYPIVEYVGICTYCGEKLYFDHDTGRYLLRPHPECAHRLERDEEEEKEMTGDNYLNSDSLKSFVRINGEWVELGDKKKTKKWKRANRIEMFFMRNLTRMRMRRINKGEDR